MDTNLTLENTEFVNNTSTAYGGAVFHANQNLTIINSTFSNNVAVEKGGAVVSQQPTMVTMKSSVFTDNSVTAKTNRAWGGAYYQLGGTLQIESTDFSENSSTDRGGALFLLDVGIVEISEQSSFTDNHAGLSGGAVYLSGSYESRIEDTVFRGNSAAFRGGAINALETNLTLENTEFFNNTCTTKP